MAYNILIVDDSSIVRKVLLKTLHMTQLPLGEVLEAGNGKEAIPLVESHWVDLILLDINMPEMNGVEFVHWLRDQEKFRTIPVVVISTEGGRVRKAELADRDIRAYLRKPVTPEQLIELFQEVLNHEQG